MHKQITVRPLSWWAYILDLLMWPIMVLLQVPHFTDLPQRTHRWNNQKLTTKEVSYLEMSHMVVTIPDTHAMRAWLWKIPLFHLGGWKQYVVLRPSVIITEEWYVGWRTERVNGVSQIPLTGMVRVLVGNESAEFFGITVDGRQVPLHEVGNGILGKNGIWKRVPLR